MTTHPAWVRKVLVTLSILATLTIILFLSFRLWVQPLVDQAVRLGLDQLKEQGYQIDYQKLRFRPFQRQITLEGVSVSQTKPDGYFDGTLKSLDIKLKKYPYWETDRYLAIQHISLYQPIIRLHTPDSTTKAAPASESLDYYSLIQPYVDSLVITDIRITDGLLKYITQQNEEKDTVQIAGIDLHLEEFYLDSLQSSENRGQPFMNSLVVSIDSAQRISQDSLYAFSVAKMTASVLDSTVQLKNVQVRPNISKKEWKDCLDEQKDRIEAQIARVQITGIQPSHWLNFRQLLSERISVDSAILEIYKDKHLQRSSGVRPLLSAMFRSIPIQFKVDTITIQNSQILYEEKNTESIEAGKLSLDNLYASLYNTTNLPNSTDTFEADIQADLMNSGHFSLAVQVPLDRTDGHHRLVGELNRMHLDEMNRFLEPVAFASVREGTLNKLSFEMDANQQSAQGTVHFIYNGLKVSLLNQDDPENPAIRSLLGTWLANWFVVKTDNPTRNQPLRVGNIYFNRDPTRSVFSYWSHSLLSGLKESIGLSKPTEATTSIETAAKEEPERPGLIKRLFNK